MPVGIAYPFGGYYDQRSSADFAEFYVAHSFDLI